jgi:rare lipoprotein A (peptidoglycan hydrolase)
MRSPLSTIRSWTLLAFVVFATWLAPGCARSTQPRDAGGSTIVVTRTLNGFATYYGKGFAGKPTASGEIFNPREMVAAHRTLPLGTRVRVTNLENGRRVILRVIDRGPYSGRRNIIDVSEGAARRLDFIREGRVRVRVDVLRDRDQT